MKKGKSSDLSDVEELLAQLDELMSQFVSSSIFKRDIFNKSDEDDYTSVLIKYFMNQHPNNKFSFETQAGEYAAIKRFKCGQHGLSNRNPGKAKLLSENAIVAYSKSGTFDKHLTKINSKISKLAAKATPDKFGLTWYKYEQLQKIHFNNTAKLKSTHPRVDGSEVVLHHFWVDV